MRTHVETSFAPSFIVDEKGVREPAVLFSVFDGVALRRRKKLVTESFMGRLEKLPMADRRRLAEGWRAMGFDA